ncbi:MAG TPA: putative metal-dependent hydrolase [bacterium]|nr:putative metal-dependent hydrolase [bacterium]
MLSAAERQELIEKMRQLPDQIEAAVRGLNDAQLDTPYGPGKWTVRQVAHHLADSHMNAIIRMKLVLAEDNPTLKPYNQDDWARFEDAAKLPVAPSLSIIRGVHERMVHMLRQAPESAFRRTAHHPEHGTITLDDLVGIYGRHGEKHCGQITGLRSARGW